MGWRFWGLSVSMKICTNYSPLSHSSLAALMRIAPDLPEDRYEEKVSPPIVSAASLRWSDLLWAAKKRRNAETLHDNTGRGDEVRHLAVTCGVMICTRRAGTA